MKDKRMVNKQHSLRQPLLSPAVSGRPIRDRVGVTIEATDAIDAITKIREAEHAGVQQVWCPGFAGVADTLALLSAAAVQTERIRLGTALVPIYPRHPLVMAQQALVVSDLAPGRLRLGIGPGAPMLVEDWYGFEV